MVVGVFQEGGEWIVIPWLDATKLLQAKRARKSYIYGAYERKPSGRSFYIFK